MEPVLLEVLSEIIKLFTRLSAAKLGGVQKDGLQLYGRAFAPNLIHQVNLHELEANVALLKGLP